MAQKVPTSSAPLHAQQREREPQKRQHKAKSKLEEVPKRRIVKCPVCKLLKDAVKTLPLYEGVLK